MVRRELVIAFGVIFFICFWVYFGFWPVRLLEGWRASIKTKDLGSVDFRHYQVYDHSVGEPPFITVDFLKGKHFWNPQVAIWLEDLQGRHLETLLVTTATARGLFYAGRSADNFMAFDTLSENNKTETRRVDALPFWSHKRGVQYPDGLFSPSPQQPLADAITGPTPRGSFIYSSGHETKWDQFKVMVEVNVAFDQNESFSEYDFPEDTVYHAGVGLLGQPSIVYEAIVSREDAYPHYLMKPIGHGHHSGQTGELFPDMSGLTTARFIADRIVVTVNFKEGD